jgi:hypothetical protein
MKFVLRFGVLLAFVAPLHGAIFTNSADADAFVRSNAPAMNYGGAGALTVSGASSANIVYGLTNGIADTFIRFNALSMTTNFNALFGPNNWVISGAKLQVMEVGSPNNSIFDQGVGAFQIFWVADDNWIEGTGTPMNPTTDGIVYNDESALLTNITSLGTFTNSGTSTALLFPLTLTTNFVGNLRTGGEVTLFLTSVDPQIGFTFNSHSFGTVTNRPYLEISAMPQPVITSVNLSGSNLVLSVTNGAAGGIYDVLGSTNLTLPSDQWYPVVTSVLASSGNFTITITNAITPLVPASFFFLRTQ